MIKVNLLSPEKKEMSGGGADVGGFPDEERESKVNVVAGVAVAVLTVLLIGFMYISQANTIEEKEKLLQERRARKKELDTVLKTLSELEKAKKLLERKVKLISDLKSRQQDTVKMMDQLADALPDWVWIQDLSFSGKLLSIRGKAIHNNLISDFINNLKGTGCFYDVQFPGSDRQKVGGLDIFNFRITCHYKDKDLQKGKKSPNKKLKKRKV